MTIRSTLIVAGLTLLAGCGPNPNVPEPPPPPPVAPVAPLPVDPAPTPMVNPASLPGNTDNPSPPQPVDPAPPPTKSTAELARELERSEDRQAAAAALAAQGKEAIPVLTKALDNADWQIRAAAIFGLGKLGADAASARDKLQTIAEKDENEEVRVAAAFALDALAEGTRDEGRGARDEGNCKMNSK